MFMHFFYLRNGFGINLRISPVIILRKMVSRNRPKGQYMKAGNQGGQEKSDMEMMCGSCHENLRFFKDHIQGREPRN